MSLALEQAYLHLTSQANRPPVIHSFWAQHRLPLNQLVLATDRYVSSRATNLHSVRDRTQSILNDAISPSGLTTATVILSNNRFTNFETASDHGIHPPRLLFHPRRQVGSQQLKPRSHSPPHQHFCWWTSGGCMGCGSVTQ